MAYAPQNGHVNDALFRRQSADALAGNYPVEPAPKASIGDSTTTIDIGVAAGVTIFGGEVVPVGQETVTLPDAPAAGSGPDGGDPERVDLITTDSNGNAGRMVGDPAVPEPAGRTFPNVIRPLPPTPTPTDDVVVIAAVNVGTGVTSSQEMFADAVVPREVMGDAVNDLQLIPGRDLQYEINSAREGATLRGDRSQVIHLDQPIAVTTPDVTLRNLNLRYVDGAAANDSDDMLTLAAGGVTVENVTIDGNKANQTTEPDGITVAASNCTVRDIRGKRTAGHCININGGSGAVENTIVRNIIANDCRKDALVVQGNGVYRVNVTSIYGFNGDTRGTATLRNGVEWVSLDDIYGEDQSRTLHIEDFGGGGQGIVACSASNVRSNRCTRLVTSDTASGARHRGITLDKLYGRDFSPTGGGGVVDLRNMSGIKLTRAFLNDDYSGAYAIYCANVEEASITNSTLRNSSPERGGISLVNSDLIDVAGNFIRPFGNGSIRYGVLVQVASGNHAFPMIHNNVIGAGATDSVRFNEEDQGNLTRFSMTHNVAKPPNNDTDAAAGSYIIKDNLSP